MADNAAAAANNKKSSTGDGGGIGGGVGGGATPQDDEVDSTRRRYRHGHDPAATMQFSGYGAILSHRLSSWRDASSAFGLSSEPMPIMTPEDPVAAGAGAGASAGTRKSSRGRARGLTGGSRKESQDANDDTFLLSALTTRLHSKGGAGPAGPAAGDEHSSHPLRQITDYDLDDALMAAPSTLPLRPGVSSGVSGHAPQQSDLFMDALGPTMKKTKTTEAPKKAVPVPSVSSMTGVGAGVGGRDGSRSASSDTASRRRRLAGTSPGAEAVTPTVVEDLEDDEDGGGGSVQVKVVDLSLAATGGGGGDDSTTGGAASEIIMTASASELTKEDSAPQPRTVIGGRGSGKRVTFGALVIDEDQDDEEEDDGGGAPPPLTMVGRASRSMAPSVGPVDGTGSTPFDLLASTPTVIHRIFGDGDGMDDYEMMDPEERARMMAGAISPMTMTRPDDEDDDDDDGDDGDDGSVPPYDGVAMTTLMHADTLPETEYDRIFVSAGDTPRRPETDDARSGATRAASSRRRGDDELDRSRRRGAADDGGGTGDGGADGGSGSDHDGDVMPLMSSELPDMSRTQPNDSIITLDEDLARTDIFNPMTPTYSMVDHTYTPFMPGPPPSSGAGARGASGRGFSDRMMRRGR